MLSAPLYASSDAPCLHSWTHLDMMMFGIALASVYVARLLCIAISVQCLVNYAADVSQLHMHCKHHWLG